MKYYPQALRPGKFYFCRIAGLAVVICLSLLLSAPASYSLDENHILKTDIWPMSALPTSLSVGQVNVAILPMGGNDSIINKFWQLFYYNKITDRWQDIIGKSGVATNGGLTVNTTATDRLLLAFLPSILLKFTPTDILTPNTAAPSASRYSPSAPILTGILPTPADMAQISNNTLLSLGRYKNGTGLIATQITKNNWHHIYLSRDFSMSCQNGNLTAIYDTGNLLLAGMGCPGVTRQSMVYTGNQVKNNILDAKYINFAVPNSLLQNKQNEVMKNNLSTETLLFNGYTNQNSNLSGIQTTNNKTFSALDTVLVHTPHAVYPLGFYSFSLQEYVNAKSANQAGDIELKPNFRKENFLPISPQYKIISVGRYGSSSYFIVAVRKRQNPVVFISVNTKLGWRKIVNLPPATVTIARIDNGETESFAVAKKHFLVYRYIGKRWILAQDSTIDIQHGSSS